MATKRKSTARRSAATKRPDHSAQLARIKRIKGQIEGIQRMIEERRDCPAILLQTAAARAALRSLEVSMIRDHVDYCVKHALREPGGPDAKLNELLTLFQRLTA